MKELIMMLLSFSMLFSGTACGAKRETPRTPTAEKTMAAQETTRETKAISQTGWTAAVPDEYKAPAAHGGTVERLDYATKDYAGSGGDIQKTAYVYLPYGYEPNDAAARYDIIYLMHGWGGSAGEYFNLGTLKNTFDQLIERGDMKPAIMVSATFYHSGSNTDFGSEVTSDPAFDDYGRLLLPVNSGYMSGDTLGNLRLTWYSNIDPNKSVEVVNTLRERALSGETVFYDIYTDAEKAADPAKRNTGLFFFKGDGGAPFAVCNAGGGFSYVGAMHDSFPHALELSKMGYNAFALIYRPGWDTAMEDLGRAISFIEDNADALGVAREGYSLWGGSAGARMAATLGNADELACCTGRTDIPRAAAVIMQYTGHTETSRADAPTYACCGTSDGIANWRTMQSRLNRLSSYGIPTEFHAYEGLPHGFGLGTGTVAEGWINDAVAFWEANQ